MLSTSGSFVLNVITVTVAFEFVGFPFSSTYIFLIKVTKGNITIFECNDIEKLSEYCLSYNSTTNELTFDVNAWNSKEGVEKVTPGDLMIAYYIEK